MNRIAHRGLHIPVLALVLLGIWAGTASANDLFTLDTKPTSPAHVIVDSAGTAYVGWTRAGSPYETPMFCKIPAGGTCAAPVALPIPGAVDSTDEVSGVFPVFGPGSTVYVVAPRYVADDVVIWTSNDGGQSFELNTVNPGGYSNKTNPSNVFLSGSNFLIGAFNAGLGFSETPAPGGTGSNLSFENPGTGGVASASLGLDGSGNPVLAYWNLSDPYPMLFYRYKGSGSSDLEVNWVGPTPIGNGYETKLAGGPKGLFLVSQDYAGGKYPTVVNVRKYTGTEFGAPSTLFVDPSPALYDGGAIAESTGSGRLAVAWPVKRAGDDARVMRLFTSTDGGATFTSFDVAHVADAYAIGDNAQLAVTDGGSGWLTFRDVDGLHMADLTPIAGVAPKEPPKPANYKGKSKVADTKKVGGYDLTLRLPKACVQSRQSFFAGVGKRKRHALAKKLGGKIRLKKVAFFFDGKKLKVKKKKPFRLLIDPGPMAPGSTHVVKAKVTVTLTKKNGQEKKVKRTLKGTIKAC
jgi:hypothetical protein